MKILLTTREGKIFTQVNTWDAANVAAKAVIKHFTYSDLYYSITFDNGEEVAGSIDLEPRSFHTPYWNCIVTKHLKTFWTNISKLPAPKYGLTQEDIEECKKLLQHLPPVKI